MISGTARIAIALCVLGPLAASVWLAARGKAASGAGGDEGSGPAAEKWTSSAQCLSCHQQVAAEWKGSHHRMSYVNPEVRKLSDDFKNKECQACHLPRPVFVTGLGNRTLHRVTRPDEGVDCLTCHLAADGAILGRSSRPDVPCAPRADAGVVAVDMCQSCHNQHKTTDQWRASEYAKRGEDCAHCHMQEAARPGTESGRGRSHAFPAAHDAGMLKKASRLEVARDGEQLVVALANVAAGHNFPTEERHRAVDILVRFEPAGAGGPSKTGDEVRDWQRVWRFRQPYRDEPGENTQLPAGQTHTEKIWIPKGAARAFVRLWYRLNPYATDQDPASTLLEEKEIAL